MGSLAVTGTLGVGLFICLGVGLFICLGVEGLKPLLNCLSVYALRGEMTLARDLKTELEPAARVISG